MPRDGDFTAEDVAALRPVTPSVTGLSELIKLGVSARRASLDALEKSENMAFEARRAQDADPSLLLAHNEDHTASKRLENESDALMKRSDAILDFAPAVRPTSVDDAVALVGLALDHAYAADSDGDEGSARTSIAKCLSSIASALPILAQTISAEARDFSICASDDRPDIQDLTKWRPELAIRLGCTESSTPAENPSSNVGLIKGHFRAWVAAREEWARLLITDDPEGNGETPEILAAQDREDAAQRAIMAIEPTTPAAIAIYAALLWDHVADDLRALETDENGRPVSMESHLAAAIWRAATGQQTAPPNGSMSNAAEAWPDVLA